MSFSTSDDDIVQGTYLETTSHALTANTPYQFSIDGSGYKGEVPNGVGLWNTSTNLMQFSDSDVHNYVVRVGFNYTPSIVGGDIQIRLKINGGSNSIIAENTIALNVLSDRPYSFTSIIYTGAEVRQYGVKVEVQPSVNGTLSHESIVITKS